MIDVAELTGWILTLGVLVYVFWKEIAFWTIYNRVKKLK